MSEREECTVLRQKLNVLPSCEEEEVEGAVVGRGRFPSWLHRPLSTGATLHATERIMSRHRLYTVCEEAKCPNLPDCWSHGVATFLIMGRECTRQCGFCDIAFSRVPLPLDAEEPSRVAASVQELGLRHVVITMVARDDLPDGGAHHLATVVETVRRQNALVTVEVLTSDFGGNEEAWRVVAETAPDVFNHNIETVRELSPRVRHRATYERSLSLLRYAAAHRKQGKMKVKSGLMVGLGETDSQLYATLVDLKAAGCDIVTIGQYLQSSARRLRVKAFVPPHKFDEYASWGTAMGISLMQCGPFVRSSYHAHRALDECL